MRGYIIAGIITLCWIGKEGQIRPCKNIVRHEAIQIRQNDTSLTRETLFAEIKKAKILPAEVCLRQAMLETGWLSCRNCSLDRNNLFGFATDRGYLDFATWQESVYYYATWLRRKGYKGEDIYDFLRRKWVCEDIEHYIEQLKKIKL